MFVALSAPLTAHAFLTNDELLSYTAMPLAVSNVCDLQGVQTDEVATLVSYMDRANVSPDAFVDVFRYVPVALVLNSGRRPDFVSWVGSEVDQGIVGDQLVTAMEGRLETYGNRIVTVSDVRRYRHRRPRYYSAFDETTYVPVAVRRYCAHELLDPYAVIDMPLAVTQVVDLGVPIARVGNLVLQLDLGYVPAVQTVEILRYAPPALVAVDYGQPDFVQYVYDQRVGGFSGYDLARVVDQQLPVYGVSPQIDLSAPVYYGANTYVPSVVQNYVAPVDPTFIPPPVQTQVASFAPGRTAFNAPTAPQVAAQPQVQRLLQGQGNAVVTNPAQARRELAQSMRNGNRAFQAPATAVAPTFAPAIAAARGGGRAQHVAHERAAAPMRVAAAPQAVRGGGQAHGHGRGNPHVMTARPAPAAAAPVMAQPRGQGHGQGRGHGGGPPAVMAAPQPMAAPARGQGQGHGRGHGGGPPAAVMMPQPAPAAAPAPAPAPPGQGNDRGNGNGNGKKKGH